LKTESLKISTKIEKKDVFHTREMLETLTLLASCGNFVFHPREGRKEWAVMVVLI
jgi:hypothetical protein